MGFSFGIAVRIGVCAGGARTWNWFATGRMDWIVSYGDKYDAVPFLLENAGYILQQAIFRPIQIRQVRCHPLLGIRGFENRLKMTDLRMVQYTMVLNVLSTKIPLKLSLSIRWMQQNRLCRQYSPGFSYDERRSKALAFGIKLYVRLLGVCRYGSHFGLDVNSRLYASPLACEPPLDRSNPSILVFIQQPNDPTMGIRRLSRTLSMITTVANAQGKLGGRSIPSLRLARSQHHKERSKQHIWHLLIEATSDLSIHPVFR